MPLITRNSQNANVKLGTTAQLATITFTDGDLASDTTTNKVKVFNGTTLSEIGATSFSSSAVVSQSTTIGDYTTPSAIVSTSPSSPTVEYLVIGGGAAGGMGSYNGGGGAGAYRTAAGHAVSSISYAITVGAGGVGRNADNSGSNGNSSIFDTITAEGGAGGAGNYQHTGSTGTNGSGGGGAIGLAIGGAGGTYGKNGGTGSSWVAPYLSGGGGGGGAGTNGSNGYAGGGGAGGSGVASSITGVSVTRAGGGGGSGGDSNTSNVAGAGGSGGGGAGGLARFDTAGTNGTANTGGGGGGGGSGAVINNGNGGSGIVILKYLTSSMSATGGTITTSGLYTIHSFTSNGNFVVSYGSGANAIDNDVTTKWKSDSESNPNAYVDMGSALNLCAAAFYFNSTDTTNTEILIQSSPDASVWTTKRTITTSNLSNGAYNYYRFNIAGGARYIRFYGNSAGSTVLSIWEIKIMKKTDAEIFNDLGMLTITASDTSLGPDGT